MPFDMKTSQAGARRIIEIFEKHPEIPDFVTDAIGIVLNEASELKGINIYKPHSTTEGFEKLCPVGLGKLFNETELLGFDHKTRPRGSKGRFKSC